MPHSWEAGLGRAWSQERILLHTSASTAPSLPEAFRHPSSAAPPTSCLTLIFIFGPLPLELSVVSRARKHPSSSQGEAPDAPLPLPCALPSFDIPVNPYWLCRCGIFQIWLLRMVCYQSPAVALSLRFLTLLSSSRHCLSLPHDAL